MDFGRERVAQIELPTVARNARVYRSAEWWRCREINENIGCDLQAFSLKLRFDFVRYRLRVEIRKIDANATHLSVAV